MRRWAIRVRGSLRGRGRACEMDSENKLGGIAAVSALIVAAWILSSCDSQKESTLQQIGEQLSPLPKYTASSTATYSATAKVVPKSTIDPSFTTTFTMPDYYKPHPALMPVQQWELLSSATAIPLTHKPTPLVDMTQESYIAQRPEFANGIIEKIISPSGNKVLIIAQVKLPSATLLRGRI